MTVIGYYADGTVALQRREHGSPFHAISTAEDLFCQCPYIKRVAVIKGRFRRRVMFTADRPPYC